MKEINRILLSLTRSSAEVIKKNLFPGCFLLHLISSQLDPDVVVDSVGGGGRAATSSSVGVSPSSSRPSTGVKAAGVVFPDKVLLSPLTGVMSLSSLRVGLFLRLRAAGLGLVTAPGKERRGAR